MRGGPGLPRMAARRARSSCTTCCGSPEPCESAGRCPLLSVHNLSTSPPDHVSGGFLVVVEWRWTACTRRVRCAVLIPVDGGFGKEGRKTWGGRNVAYPYR